MLIQFGLIILTITCLIGQFLVQRQNRIGTMLWIIADFWWMIYNIIIGEYVQAFLWAAYFVLSIYGWFTWNKKPNIKIIKSDIKCCPHWTELDDAFGSFEYCRILRVRCFCGGDGDDLCERDGN